MGGEQSILTTQRCPSILQQTIGGQVIFQVILQRCDLLTKHAQAILSCCNVCYILIITSN